MHTTLKKLIVLQFAFACCILTNSCNNSNSTNGTSNNDTSGNAMKKMEGSVSEEANKAATAIKEEVVKNPDSTFVAEVALSNNEEIGMLQAGIDKGNDKDLKKHAKMMMADHKDLRKKLETYAASKSYPIASDDEGKSAKEVDDMSSKTGKDWDKAWVNAMFDAHEKAIGKFEGAENNVKDGELKTLIASTLPTLRSHLDMMKKLQDKIK